MPSTSFGSKQPTGTVQSKSGLAADVIDLRNDVEEAFVTCEALVDVAAKRTSYPELEWLDGAAPAVNGGAVVLRGSGLLQGQTFDAATIADGDASIVLTALKPGDSPLSVEVVAPSSTLLVSFAANKLTIRPASGGSTDDAIATAINADNSACRGIIRAASAGGGSFTNAVAEQSFAGGTGLYAGNKVTISGVECLPANTTGTAGAAAWTDTAITVTMPDMTAETPARAAADNVVAKIKSNGLSTGGVSLLLGTAA